MALFIILLVLVQRGRGGGLAGALGGPGGSSAFGAKAGDTFTRITIVTVIIWIIMCLAAIGWASNRGDALDAGGDSTVITQDEEGIGAAAGEADAETAAPSEDAEAPVADSDEE